MCKECEENKSIKKEKEEIIQKVETKVCKTCGEEKPVNEFNSKGQGYHSSNCKVCESLKNKNIDYNTSD